MHPTFASPVFFPFQKYYIHVSFELDINDCIVPPVAGNINIRLESAASADGPHIILQSLEIESGYRERV